MMAKTKGARYKPAMEFVVSIFSLGGASQGLMHSIFLRSSESNRKSRLHGWLLWWRYCCLCGLDAAALKAHESPEILFAEFLVYLDRQRTSAHMRSEVTPAVQVLFDLLRRDVKLIDHSLVHATRRNTNCIVKSRPRHDTI